MATSVEKAMAILTAISKSIFNGMPLNEISEKTGINKSTCVHILNALKKNGYVEKISHSKGYRLGPGIYYLTRYGRFQEELIQLCSPIMNWLYRETGQTVLLAVIYENKKYIVHYVEGERVLEETRTNLYEGNIYASGTGRVMLSFFSRYMLKLFVDENGLPEQRIWPQVKSFEDLWRELKIIRRQPVLYYSMSDAGLIDSGLAAPLLGGNGKCVGAVAISLPKITSQRTQEEIDALRVLLKRAVNGINKRIADKMG